MFKTLERSVSMNKIAKRKLDKTDIPNIHSRYWTSVAQ